MNRKFLEELGLEKETIEKVMAEHGKAIQDAKPAEDIEELKSEKATLEKKVGDLETTLNATTEKYTDIDTTLAEKDKLLKNYETTNLKFRIANQAGIPLDLAERLSGETEDEIKADAEKLSEFVSRKEVLPLKPTEPEDIEEKPYSNQARILEEQYNAE